jgi:Protein of unknown function (DUF2490)
MKNSTSACSKAADKWNDQHNHTKSYLSVLFSGNNLTYFENSSLIPSLRNAIRPPRFLPRRVPLWKAWILFAAILLSLPCNSWAQTSIKWPRTDFQGWTEFEVAHKLSSYADVTGNGGLRWSNDADHLVYRRVGTAVNFKLSKFLTLSPAYAFYYTDSSRIGFSHENRISIAATAGTSINKWRISDRNGFEKRFTSSGHSWRYRNRIEIQHPFKLGRHSFLADVWDEVFYDSSVKAWARNRAAAGAEKEITPRLRVGLYLIHQNDGRTLPGDLNAIAVTIRTRL